MNNNKEPKSPCINVCRYNSNNLCSGCFRTVEEISLWGSLNNKEKQKVLDNVSKRKAEVMDYYGGPV